MLYKEDPRLFGFEGVTKAVQSKQPEKPKPEAARFVQRTYKLVPLTELEQDAYGPGGPCSGKPMPRFREVLVSERSFEGIG